MHLAKYLTALLFTSFLLAPVAVGQQRRPLRDAKNTNTGKSDPEEDPALEKYGIYAATAPRPVATEPLSTELPLELEPRVRVAMIGNMLLERSQYFGHLETLVHQRYPSHQIVIRHLGWPADTVDLRPRPDNFADLQQHLYHERIDVILAAFGFNESFDGADGLASFRAGLREFVSGLKSSAFNGQHAPKIVLLSPIANENVHGVAAADMNNERIAMYAEVIRQVAGELDVGLVDVYEPTLVR